MRKLIVCTLVLTGLIAAQAFAATRTVPLGDDWFVRKGGPYSVTVKKGTTVRWAWRGEDLHNVMVTRGPEAFHSRLKDSGEYRKRVTRVGTYRIVCSIHQPDMRMTLKVVR